MKPEPAAGPQSGIGSSMAAPRIYEAYMYSYPHKTAYGPLSGVNVFDYLESCDLKEAEVYFHIPFCADKCGYCNLFSVAGQSEEYFERYLCAMAEQISHYGLRELAPRRITLGGGTPLILSETLLERLLRLLPGIDKAISCIETAPNETTKARLEILKAFNVNRISVGVQSFLDSELASLKRRHSSRSVYNCLAMIKEYNFPVLNLDLIYGIPGQTISSLQTSLEEGLKFAPEEIFIYPLYVRRGTGLAGALVNEYRYDMYWFAQSLLKTAGYTQVSMRRFIKNSPLSSDNGLPKESCGFETMLAIGSGGRSYLGKLHFCHPYTADMRVCQKIIADYIDAPDKTRVTWGYILNEDEQKRRFVIKNILHVQGISPVEYREKFKTELCDDFPILREWEEQDYAQAPAAAESSGQIRLTSLGLSLSDYIGPMLVSAEVRQRMERSAELQN